MTTLNADLMSLEKLARFPEGVPADPTQNMSEEDAQKWHDMNEEYGDQFKTAYLEELAHLDLEVSASGLALDADELALEKLAKSARSMVGPTILQQMGGLRRLQAMLGIYYLRYINDGVEFGWPNKQSSKGNHVKVILEPSDTYRVEFFNTSWATSLTGRTPKSSKLVKRLDDVYAEDLVNLFERQTGWYLRLAADRTACDCDGGDEMVARFEEGVPADPTENMSEEDAQTWRDMNEKHRDNFRKEAARLNWDHDAKDKQGRGVWVAKSPNGDGNYTVWEDSDGKLHWTLRQPGALSGLGSPTTFRDWNRAAKDAEDHATGSGRWKQLVRASKTASRPLYEIAREIRRDWKNVYFGAKPYLEAMSGLDSIRDSYGSDDARSIVLYFLTNASAWRGETAKRIKAELNAMVKGRLASKEAGESKAPFEGSGSEIPDGEGNKAKRAAVITAGPSGMFSYRWPQVFAHGWAEDHVGYQPLTFTTPPVEGQVAVRLNDGERIFPATAFSWYGANGMPSGLVVLNADKAGFAEAYREFRKNTRSNARVARNNDPYWITAKYPGTDSDGKPFRKGEKVLYYPLTKTFLTGLKAEKAWREFQAAKEDEDFYSRSAASGLYGFTKATQKDCESCVRKAQKAATRIAKAAYGKNEKVAGFLSTHAQRTGSLPAEILVGALSELGPKVASTKTASGSGAAHEAAQALKLKGEKVLVPRGVTVHYNEKTKEWHTSSGSEQKTQTFTDEGKLKQWLEAHPTTKTANPSDTDALHKTAADERTARLNGLYGFHDKVATLGLQACSDLQAEVGRIAYDLHRRRETKYADITGFLDTHCKTAECKYSRLLVASYPDVKPARVSSVQDWLDAEVV